MLRSGYKRVVYDAMQGKSGHIIQAYIDDRLTLDDAVDLLEHLRKPWWVRMWWVQ